MTEQELRQKTVNLFLSHLGESEVNGLCPKWVADDYNACVAIYAKTVTSTLPRATRMAREWDWCAASYTAIQFDAGLGDVGVYEMSCTNLIAIAKAKGVWLENEALYTPDVAKIGDGIIYDWEDDGKGDCTGNPNHVGMVAEVHPDHLVIVEGNYKNSVKLRTISYNAKQVRGFIRPNYASLADKVETTPTVTPTPVAQNKFPALKRGNTGNAVKAVQTLLKYKFGYNLGTYGIKKDGIDGSFGAKTESALLASTGSKVVTDEIWLKLIKG